MDALLIIRNMKVENANAIAGFTWGFPAITNFTGFAHALSRKLQPELQVELTGCGVICQRHQVQAHQPRGWGDYHFALTRNPLTKEEKSPSFVEEGRMQMTVSLVLPVKGALDDKWELEEVKQRLAQLILSQRLAGGMIVDLGAVDWLEPPEDFEGLQKFEKKQLRKLLPGFALVERSDLLAEHFRHCQEQNPNAEPIDAMLDFCDIKYQADPVEAGIAEPQQAEWQQIPRPGGGWLVPITTGYCGISQLYPPGEVDRSRDSVTPFRFVESVYTLGQWISPHRITKLKDLIWSYHAEAETGWYLCKNSYQPK